MGKLQKEDKEEKEEKEQSTEEYILVPKSTIQQLAQEYNKYKESIKQISQNIKIQK